MHDAVDDRLRLLASSRVIEINQRLASYFFSQYGEIGAYFFYRKICHNFVYLYFDVLLIH
jgi:hypothetical protein